MARKGYAGRIAAAIRIALGENEAAYGLLKGFGNGILNTLQFLRRFLPGDVAYRVFPPRGGEPAGYVTRSDGRGLRGIAFPDPDGEPVPVELRVGGILVNKTYASQKAGEPSLYAGRSIGFYLPMRQVWPKVRTDAVIEVFAAGRKLRYRAGPGSGRPIPNRGVAAVEGKGIAELVAEGCLINKFGRVQMARNESVAWAEKAFGNYERLNAVFEREFGKTLFVFYGAMLGFAREGTILAHDLDLDLAYFSEKESPEEARREFRGFADQLVRLGIGTKAHTYKLTFSGRGLSVTPTWIAGGVFASTFGYVGDGFVVRREDILPLSRAEHAGFTLYLPSNPQAVAAYLYGKGWKYPDPGWVWLPEYKNRANILAARLTERDLRDLSPGEAKAAP